MSLFFKRIHRLLYFVSVFLVFSLCFPLLFFLARNPEKQYDSIARLRRWFSITSANLMGIRFEIDYETTIDWTVPYIICPNHSSILDIPAVTYLCEQPFSFLGKDELLNNPVTSIFFKTIDIPVNRESKVSAFRAFKRAGDLVGRGKTIVIFPEGGIDDRYPPALQKFKAGAFRIAQNTCTPVLPVVIQNAWELMWDDGAKFGSKPGVIKISVLKPIEIEGTYEKGYDSIAQEVFEKMQKSRIK